LKNDIKLKTEVVIIDSIEKTENGQRISSNNHPNFKILADSTVDVKVGDLIEFEVFGAYHDAGSFIRKVGEFTDGIIRMSPIREIILIAGKDRMSANGLKSIARDEMHEIKRWLSGQGLFGAALAMSSSSNNNPKEFVAYFGMSDLINARNLDWIQTNSARTIIAVISMMNFAEACNWTNDNIIKMPRFIKSDCKLHLADENCALRIAIQETSSRGAGCVEMFVPNKWID